MIKQTSGANNKYLNSVKLKEMVLGVQALSEEVQGRFQKVSNKIQCEAKHIQELCQLIKAEANRKEVRHNKMMEGIQVFRIQMVRLVESSAEKYQLAEEELLEEISQEIYKGEAMLQRLRSDQNEQIRAVSLTIDSQLNTKMKEFEEFRANNQRTLAVLKQVAEQRIRKSQDKIRSLRQSQEQSSESCMESLLQMYSEYHGRIGEQRGKRIREKALFLDLIDRSIQKLKEVFDQQ